MIFHGINDPVFKQHFHLLANCSKEEVEQFIKESHGENGQLHKEMLTGVGACFEVEDHGITFVYVWVKELHFEIEDLGVLSHELTHLTQKMLKNKAISDKAEVPAYYQEFAFVSCLKFLTDDKKEGKL